MSSLKKEYHERIVPKLKEEFKHSNPHEYPKLEKIVISTGLGLNAQTKNFLQSSIEEVRLISGQHPILTRAKKSIAGFKIREGMPLGLVVTLRKEKMYAFLEKLIKLVLPRIRDFRGLSPTSFDRDGNYNLGIVDRSVFPELDSEKVEKSEKKQGFTITLVIKNFSKFSGETESYALLKEFGFPFSKKADFTS
jgi:large subunit ribosomal protein L5